MNKIQLTGRLTKDPELIFAQGSGTAVTNFTLAVNRPRFDKSKEQEADFINCVCFGKKGEAVANYVKKGYMFGLSGRLQIEKYVDKDGNNRWASKVIVEDIDLLQSSNISNINNSSNYDNSNSGEQYSDLTPMDNSEDIPF